MTNLEKLQNYYYNLNGTINLSVNLHYNFIICFSEMLKYQCLFPPGDNTDNLLVISYDGIRFDCQCASKSWKVIKNKFNDVDKANELMAEIILDQSTIFNKIGYDGYNPQRINCLGSHIISEIEEAKHKILKKYNLEFLVNDDNLTDDELDIKDVLE